jgi:hypothetical protein
LLDFLTWTYLFHRLERNPTYYGVQDVSYESIGRFLSDAVDETLRDLKFAHCLEFDAEVCAFVVVSFVFHSL